MTAITADPEAEGAAYLASPPVPEGDGIAPRAEFLAARAAVMAALGAAPDQLTPLRR